MPWLVYKSTDVGAPVLTGLDQVGRNMMELLLTGPSGDGTGFAYGSMPCAGWSVAMSDSTKTVVRPGAVARSRPYFRIWQPTGDAQCYVNGYSSMTDVDTGRDPFPATPSPPSQHVTIHGLLPNSATVNGTARDWIVAADERTFIYAVKNGSTGWPASNGRWYVGYFGEFCSKVVDDPNQSCIVAARHDYGQGFSPFGCYYQSQGINASAFDARSGIYVMRNYDGGPDSVIGNWAFHMGVQPRSANQYGGQISGIFPGTNPADGKFWASHIPLCTYYKHPCVRGVLRGIWTSCAQLDYYADLSTLSMVTDDGVVNFLMLHTYGNTDGGEFGTTFHGNVLLQIGGPVPYT